MTPGPGAACPLFDAHCDTLQKVLDGQADFFSETGSSHVSLPGLERARVRTQVFACFVLSERFPTEEEERAEETIAALEGMIDASAGKLQLACSCSDLRAAFDGGPIAAILGLEGADPLLGKAENLRRYAARGVRDLIFAWKDNPFSGTAFGTNSPLTTEGHRLLGLAEELGVMVDVSHLSDRAFDDVCRSATRPFIASHSNCRTLCPSPRNLTDPMIRMLADHGGVVGITLATGFLSPVTRGHLNDLSHQLDTEKLAWRQRDQRAREEAKHIPRPSIEWVVRHVLHALNVAGEDGVGLGGDLDGVVHLPSGFDGVGDYPQLVSCLRDAGLSERQVQKICFRNFTRAFEEILPR
jgi:membrane dipeptidase